MILQPNAAFRRRHPLYAAMRVKVLSPLPYRPGEMFVGQVLVAAPNNPVGKVCDHWARDIWEPAASPFEVKR